MKDERITKEEIESFGTTLPHEVHLLYTLVLACDAMIIDIEHRMKDINETYCFERENKLRLNQYLSKVSGVKTQFENFIQPLIINSSQSDQFKDYEASRVLAQELIRLIMLYYETCKENENSNAVFDFLSKLTDSRRNVFTAKDINHFNLGLKK